MMQYLYCSTIVAVNGCILKLVLWIFVFHHSCELIWEYGDEFEHWITILISYVYWSSFIWLFIYLNVFIILFWSIMIKSQRFMLVKNTTSKEPLFCMEFSTEWQIFENCRMIWFLSQEYVYFNESRSNMFFILFW